MENTRLYTWIDVEEVLINAKEKENWPNNVLWAESYWSGVRIGGKNKNGSEEAIVKWLTDLFGIRMDTANKKILLESKENEPRYLSVEIELEDSESSYSNKIIPSFGKSSILITPSLDASNLPKNRRKDSPPIVAFHSFKGGVGRTLHAIGLAQALVRKKAKVLLINGDLEAPGLSWLSSLSLPKPEIAYTDILALFHADKSNKHEESLSLIAEKIQLVDLNGIYIVPAFRTLDKYKNVEIRPEHLIKNASNPYILVELLGELGKILGVDTVIIDLRAGLSETSAGILLDPRVHKVFVSTLSHQSVQGTCQALEEVAKKSYFEKQDTYPLPAIVLSHVPSFYAFKEELLQPEKEKLIRNIWKFWSNRKSEISEVETQVHTIITPFYEALLVLSRDWTEVIKAIEKAEITQHFESIIENWSLADNKKRRAIEDVRGKRKKLRKFTDGLSFGERSNSKDFLVIPPIEHLATYFKNQKPISIIIGGKGTGKTYTYLQIAQCKNWWAFLNQNFTQLDTIRDFSRANIIPFISAFNMEDEHNKMLKDLQNEVISDLPCLSKSLLVKNEDSLHTIFQVKDEIEESLKRNLTVSEWRDVWLNLIARYVGLNSKEDLDDTDRGVLLIDSLEDIFQEYKTNKQQQVAIRAIIQEVPAWLEHMPNRPVGLILFIREDIIQTVINENFNQLINKYKLYSLKWTQKEILELVVWIAQKSEIIKEKKPISKLSDFELTKHLTTIWGRKLGSNNSNRGITTRWVLNKLANDKNEFQARSMIQFLHYAAELSKGDTYWKDRILTPTAIKKAIEKVKNEKLEKVDKVNTPQTI